MCDTNSHIPAHFDVWELMSQWSSCTNIISGSGHIVKSILASLRAGCEYWFWFFFFFPPFPNALFTYSCLPEHIPLLHKTRFWSQKNPTWEWCFRGWACAKCWFPNASCECLFRSCHALEWTSRPQFVLCISCAPNFKILIIVGQPLMSKGQDMHIFSLSLIRKVACGVWRGAWGVSEEEWAWEWEVGVGEVWAQSGVAHEVLVGSWHRGICAYCCVHCRWIYGSMVSYVQE